MSSPPNTMNDEIKQTMPAMTEENQASVNPQSTPCLQHTNDINVDDLLEKNVGAFGLWQWLVVILCVLSAPSMSIFPVFANAVPDFRCQMEPSTERTFTSYGLNFEQTSDVVIPKQLRFPNTQYGCKRLRLNWTDETAVNALITEYLHSNGSISGNWSDKGTEACPYGYVYQSRPFQHPSTIVAEFDLVCGDAWIPPFGTFLFMIGMFFGYLIGGWLGDKYGRKPTAIGFSLLELIGAVIISTAPNHYVYHVGRTLVGLTNTGKASVLRLLPLEITLAKYRGYFSSMIILGVAFFHQSIMVGVAYILPEWRWLNAICMLPGVICFSFFFLLPESPRWLNSQKRPDKAIQVLQRGMRINRMCSRSKSVDARPLTLPVTAENTRILEDEKPKGQSRSNSSLTERLGRKWRSVKEGCPSGPLIRNLVISMSLYFTQSLAYFGILLYARVIQSSVYLIAFINATTAIPGPVLASILYRVFRYRRRPLLVSYLLIAVALSIGSLYSVIAQPESDIALTVTCNIALVLHSATMIMMSIYVAELFPSNMRTRSVGLSSGIGRLGSSLSTFVNQLDVHVRHGLPVLIYAGVGALQTVLLLILPDTTGENLPDTETKRNQVEQERPVDNEIMLNNGTEETADSTAAHA